MKNFTITAIRLTIAALLLLPAPGGYSQWTQVGPEGGVVTDLLVDGSSVYLSTNKGGVYHSMNQGMSWSEFNAGFEDDIGRWDIFEVFFLEKVDTNLFAGTFEKLLYYNATTMKWAESSLGSMQPRCALVDTFFLMGTFNGVYRSYNSGMDWTASSTGLDISFDDVVSLAVDSTGSVWALAEGFSKDTVYTSADGGYNWTGLTGLPSADRDFGTLLASDTAVFLSGSQGLYYSKDDGSTWNMVNHSDTVSVTFLKLMGDNLYVGTAFNGLYMVNSEGAVEQVSNWTGSAGLSTLVMDGSGFYAGTSTGFFKSSDLNSWMASNDGLNATEITVLAKNDMYHFAAGSGGVYRSSTGDSWENINAGVSSFEIGVLGLATYGNDIYAASALEGVFHSGDNGETWSPTGPGILPGFPVFPLFADGDTVLAAQFFGGLYRSGDKGASWSGVNGITDFIILDLTKIGNSWFAGTSGFGAPDLVYRSDDGGLNWTAMKNGISGTAASVEQIIGVGDSVILALTDEGLYRSADNGENWTVHPNGMFEAPLLAIDTSLIFLANEDSLRYSTDMFYSSYGTIEYPRYYFNYTDIIEGSLLVATEGTGIWRYGEVAAPMAPDMPVAPVLTDVGEDSVVVSWTAPADNGSAITEYLLMQKAEGGDYMMAYSGGTDMSYTARGLMPDTRYYFKVAAINAVDTSEYSMMSDTVTKAMAAMAPDAIDTLYVDSIHQTFITFYWDVPEDNGSPITNYIIQWGDGVTDVMNNPKPGYSGTDTVGTIYGLEADFAPALLVGVVNAVDTTWSPFNIVGDIKTLAKMDQTIDFGALMDKMVNDDSFVVSATASSGNMVTFTVVSGPATISGDTVMLDMDQAGKVTIRASQAGDSVYNPAPDVDQVFCINPEKTMIMQGESPDHVAAVGCETCSEFVWYMDGSMVAGETSDIYLTSESGTYYAIGMTFDGCSTSSDTVDITFTTGLDDQVSREIGVYPNPFTDHTRITFANPDRESFTLRIYDLSGKIVRNIDNMFEEELLLDRGLLKEGFYVLELSGSKTYRRSLIVR